jgi:hypothetical protein
MGATTMARNKNWTNADDCVDNYIELLETYEEKYCKDYTNVDDINELWRDIFFRCEPREEYIEYVDKFENEWEYELWLREQYGIVRIGD